MLFTKQAGDGIQSNGSYYSKRDKVEKKLPPGFGGGNVTNGGGTTSRGGGSRRKLCFRPLYLVMVVSVSWLAYRNINSIFQMEAATSSSSSSSSLGYEDHSWMVPAKDFYDSVTSSTKIRAQDDNDGMEHWMSTGPANTNATTTNTTNDANSSVPPRTLHIYWLVHQEEDYSSVSFDQATIVETRKRRERMEQAFRTFRLHPDEIQPIQKQGGIVTQVPWWTNQQVMDIFLPAVAGNRHGGKLASRPPRLLLTNNVTLKTKEQRPKIPTEYSYDQAARLVTHLTALVEAYKAGHEQVLILEDDAILTQAFFNHWHTAATLAPKDWTILQWATSNIATLEQTYPLPEPWISWLPDLWGTQAYLINREGLKAIHKRLARERTTQQRGGEQQPPEIYYTVDEQFKNILVADELLFPTPYQHAYTSTYPWIVTDAIRKSMDWTTPLGKLFAESPPALALPDLSKFPPTRNESLLVLMNIRFATSKRMGLEMDRALSDMETVCAVHRYTKCHWIIQGVFTQEYLLTRFKEKYHGHLPSNIIHFENIVGSARFNKFGLLKKHLSKMSDYDLVLTKDNDQRLTGFPWASFLDKMGNAMVGGPLRQAPEESFLRTKIWEKSQHYKLHDAQGWKKEKFAPWAKPLFVNASAIEVPFLEMYFNVFDGKFSKWFFSQILTKNFTEQDSCWGPDFLWCPAAKEYAAATGQNNRMGCALVPFVSVHEDTRQIKKDGEAFNQRGYAAVENLRHSHPSFDRWYNISYKYARGVIAWRQLDAIAKHCRTKLLRGVYNKLSQNIDFAACRDAGLARKNIV